MSEDVDHEAEAEPAVETEPGAAAEPPLKSTFAMALDKIWQGSQIVSAALVWVIAVLLLFGLIWVLYRPSGTVLVGLPDGAYARGVITFIITLATVAIALIVAITGVQRGQATGKNEQEAAQARFERGKQVLTILVGILGTIVGYYFASDDEDPAKIRVLAPRFQQAELIAGQPAALSTAVSGGTSPYSYELTFEGLDVEEVKGETPDGWISESFQLPVVEGGEDTEFSVKVLVKDSKDRSAEAEKESTLKAASSRLKPVAPSG